MLWPRWRRPRWRWLRRTSGEFSRPLASRLPVPRDVCRYPTEISFYWSVDTHVSAGYNRIGGTEMNLETFIDTLNAEQQQTAFDLLWHRLSADPTVLPSPSWHGEVLAYREANPSEKPKMSVVDAKAEVKRMIDEHRSSR